MKKSFLFYLTVLLLPFLGYAQEKNPPLLEDFAKKVKTSASLVFNDHLNIMQTSNDDDKFTLTAINDKMQVTWKSTLDGYCIQIDKFKNKIVALSAAKHSTLKGTKNTYRAYIIDPETGNIAADKIIYQSPDDYIEFPQMSTGDGKFFQLAVRQSGLKRNISFGSSFGYIFGNGYTREINQTRALKVISYNEQLDSVNTFNPAISNGTFISVVWNKHSDLFISWLNGPSIEVYKYDAGKTTPGNQLTVPVAFREDKSLIPKNLLFLQTAQNPNVLYYSVIYLNQDKDPELGIGKLDFETSKSRYVVEVIDKKTLKAIGKDFKPVNKSIDDVDFGNPKGMNIKYINEVSGKLVIALASDMSISSNYGVTFYENSLLINVLDENLNLKFQQVLPANSRQRNTYLKTGYYASNNKLHIIANAKKGLTSTVCMYAELNLGTGRWEAMDYLSKKHIDNDNFSDGPTVLWYHDSCIVPYFDPKGFSQSKYNITLQLNQY